MLKSNNATQVRMDYQVLMDEVLLEVIFVGRQMIAEIQLIETSCLNALACSFSSSMKFAL